MSTPPAGPPSAEGRREGSLEAPTRHPLEWRSDAFYDSAALEKELERVFDICHGCRRCFNLCAAFPTLFDAVDATSEGEVQAVDRKVYWQVVDNCYLCDMCFMTKCPYVPPHPWAVDFPHLMLRAKATHAATQGFSLRDRALASTEAVGRIAGIAVVAEVVNAVNRFKPARVLLEKTLGVARDAPLPQFHSSTARSRLAGLNGPLEAAPAGPAPATREELRGRGALFTTCYGNRNEPDLATDLVAVFNHNDIAVRLVPKERCCGIPRLELGDLKTVAAYKEENIPQLLAVIAAGYDIVAPIPSCVLMFKQELPLMFPDDADVKAVAARIYDPFEYLMLRHRSGALKTTFKNSLGTVSYHVPCHLRVQNIGLKTRDVLRLVPGTTVDVIERCSGHDGTYAVKREFRSASVKIGRPVASRGQNAAAAHYASDCPMAGHQIESLLPEGSATASAASARGPEHPLKLLRLAYGI